MLSLTLTLRRTSNSLGFPAGDYISIAWHLNPLQHWVSTTSFSHDVRRLQTLSTPLRRTTLVRIRKPLFSTPPLTHPQENPMATLPSPKTPPPPPPAPRRQHRHSPRFRVAEPSLPTFHPPSPDKTQIPSRRSAKSHHINQHRICLRTIPNRPRFSNPRRRNQLPSASAPPRPWAAPGRYAA